MEKKKYCPKCNHTYYDYETSNVLTTGSVIDFMKKNIKSFSDEEMFEIKNLLDKFMKDDDTFIFIDKKERVNNITLKDKNGNIITKRGYYDIQKFINGYAIVVISKDLFSSNPDDYCYGVIDKEGEEVIEPGSEGTYGSEGLHYVITEIDVLRKKANGISKTITSKKNN